MLPEEGRPMETARGGDGDGVELTSAEVATTGGCILGDGGGDEGVDSDANGGVPSGDGLGDLALSISRTYARS